jgi:multiple sugar transport system permease protein
MAARSLSSDASRFRRPGASGVRASVAAIRYLVAASFVGVCVFPLYIVVTTALKDDRDVFTWPPVWRFHPTLKNFYDALFVFGGQGAITFLANSVAITCASTLLSVGLGSMAAYGLARFSFRARKHLSFWILSTRFAPPIAFVVPMYLMFLELDLLDSHIGLIFIYTSMNLSLVIWLLRGFFSEIPIEIEEAARVDGYTPLQIFWRVALPLVRPGIVTAGILSAVFSWNEFLFASVLTQANSATLPVYLSGFSSAMGLAWGPYMAVGVIAVLPITVVTIVLQKHLVRGLTFGAVR